MAWINPFDVDYAPGETWEDFSGSLLFWGTTLKAPKNIDEDSEKKWERSRFDKLEKDGWIGMAQEAWTYLNTAPKTVADFAPARALELLDQAGQEAILMETLQGPQFWQKSRKERASRYRVLLKTRGQAGKAIAQAITALQAYRDAARVVEEYQPGAHHLYIENLHPEKEKIVHAVSNKIGTYLTAVQEIENQLERIENPAPLAKGLGKRGRRQKEALNKAIQGLTKLFYDCGMSKNKANDYTHCILYLAGLWDDDNPSGLRAKVASLRKRPQFPCWRVLFRTIDQPS